MGEQLERRRVAAYVLPNAPFPALRERWKRAEDLGFDAIYLADHTGDFRNLDGHWFEAWTTLAAMATVTSRARIGLLVANPVLRPPAVVAKAAVTVDHLSGGRLDLGVGTGIAGFDHDAVGVAYWDLHERLARFTEYVEALDGLLRSRDRSFQRVGGHVQTFHAPCAPAPVQKPRPPIVLGGQSRSVRQLAARLADGWNTHGGFGLSYDKILEDTGNHNRVLDDDCRSAGRSPADVRRSVLLFEALDPWLTGVDPSNVATDFRSAGVQDFVLFWPSVDREDELADVLSRLRSG
ncbi:MAG: LLM class flavin-dependent oxidoreductase [Actinomycetota bacterium]|nr:LLM class flavin-dependent oxidoreductase [Actinomycetota bacterium]